MITDYIKTHVMDGRYDGSDSPTHVSAMGWEDLCALPHFVLSHRKTHYTPEDFYERLHSHDFYEIVFYVSGKIEYVNCDHVNTPYSGNVIINKPGEGHTARLLGTSVYERFVLYFDREFLSCVAGTLPLLSHIDGMNNYVFGFDSATSEMIFERLVSARDGLRSNEPISISRAYADLITLLSLVCEHARPSDEVRNIPGNVLKIKQYIDINSASVSDVNTLADEFFYSREHLSRVFKRYFNITVSDYIAICKVNASKPLLLKGYKISDVSERCGFGTPTSFLRTFKKFAKMTPSEFVKSQRSSQKAPIIK